MADNEELLPCPFCGSRPVTTVSCAPETEGMISVGCAQDATICPVSPHVFASTRSGAIAAWNKREALSRDTESGWREVLRMAELYADFIRHHVKAADIEMHPYLPELESIIERAKQLPTPPKAQP